MHSLARAEADLEASLRRGTPWPFGEQAMNMATTVVVEKTGNTGDGTARKRNKKACKITLFFVQFIS
jgi:hypothetical protein